MDGGVGFFYAFLCFVLCRFSSFVVFETLTCLKLWLGVRAFVLRIQEFMATLSGKQGERETG
jgi:hypothetical protein